MRLWELEAAIGHQLQQNSELQLRNETLAAEVIDLKTGLDAIEERARSELGMVKPGEAYLYIIESNTAP